MWTVKASLLTRPSYKHISDDTSVRMHCGTTFLNSNFATTHCSYTCLKLVTSKVHTNNTFQIKWHIPRTFSSSVASLLYVLKLGGTVLGPKFNSVTTHHEPVHLRPPVLSTRHRMLPHEITYVWSASHTCNLEASIHVWVWDWARIWISIRTNTWFKCVIPGTSPWVQWCHSPISAVDLYGRQDPAWN